MNRFFTACLAAGLLVLTGCKSINIAATKPAENANMLAPLVEKRETLTATGYAVVSVQNHRNPAQQRLMAIRASKLDAYRASLSIGAAPAACAVTHSRGRRTHPSRALRTDRGADQGTGKTATSQGTGPTPERNSK